MKRGSPYKGGGKIESRDTQCRHKTEKVKAKGKTELFEKV